MGEGTIHEEYMEKGFLDLKYNEEVTVNYQIFYEIAPNFYIQISLFLGKIEKC